MFALGSSDKSIRMWKFKDNGGQEFDESPGSEEEQLRTELMDEDEVDRENLIFQSTHNKEEMKQDYAGGNKFAPVR